MSKIRVFGSILLLLTFAFLPGNLNAQISAVTAVSLKAGETGSIEFDITDYEDKVASISGVVIDYPEYTFELFDDGTSGDIKSKDGIWSIELPVPYDASPEKYYLKCTAYDSSGNPVMVKSTDGKEKRFQFTFIVNVIP